MMILVMGRGDSGKSSLAEQLACECGLSRRYYIATMKVLDEDGKARIKKHRLMRSGKGFVTLEIPVDIENAPEYMDDPADAVVLLECVTNLVGNMMHEPAWHDMLISGSSAREEDFVRKVVSKVDTLEQQVPLLIAVTGTYEAEETDDEDTAIFKRLLHEVNLALSRKARKIYDTDMDKASEEVSV